jgi:hypothetical protein
MLINIIDDEELNRKKRTALSAVIQQNGYGISLAINTDVRRYTQGKMNV